MSCLGARFWQMPRQAMMMHLPALFSDFQHPATTLHNTFKQNKQSALK
jgi:hypothetical protein